MLFVLLLVVLAEVGLRWQREAELNARIERQGSAWEASMTTHRASADAGLVYELVPGAQATRNGVSIRINASGFRDDEFPAEATGATAIVVLGDSVAMGWGVPMEQAFPQLLERRLAEHTSANEKPPIVYNLAVDGYSTEQEIRLLELRGLPLRPDLMIVSYVLNDPDIADGGLTRYYTSRIELLEIAKRALRRVHGVSTGKSRPTEYHRRIHAIHRDRIRENFQRLGRIRREKGVPILVAVTPVFDFRAGEAYPWQDLHDAIERLSEENGLAYLDFAESFRGRDSEEFALDLWHPNARGHEAMARALADRLREFSQAR